MIIDRKTAAKFVPDDKAWRKFTLKDAPKPSPPPREPKNGA